MSNTKKAVHNAWAKASNDAGKSKIEVQKSNTDTSHAVEVVWNASNGKKQSAETTTVKC